MVFLKRTTIENVSERSGYNMENKRLEYLKSFGLTGQEATIYISLLKMGAATGYEVAKETGISRSNVYGSLAALVDKGAAYLIEGETSKYTPVAMDDYCRHRLRQLQEMSEFLVSHTPVKREDNSGYITIAGGRHISDKILDMLNMCSKRMYIMASGDVLSIYEEQLLDKIKAGIKVVILSDGYELEGALVYRTNLDSHQIRFITDSAYVLTGMIAEYDEDCVCLYSAQPLLVNVMKEALGNRISLIESEGKQV